MPDIVARVSRKGSRCTGFHDPCRMRLIGLAGWADTAATCLIWNESLNTFPVFLAARRVYVLLNAYRRSESFQTPVTRLHVQVNVDWRSNGGKPLFFLATIVVSSAEGLLSKR